MDTGVRRDGGAGAFFDCFLSWLYWSFFDFLLHLPCWYLQLTFFRSKENANLQLRYNSRTTGAFYLLLGAPQSNQKAGIQPEDRLWGKWESLEFEPECCKAWGMVKQESESGGLSLHWPNLLTVGCPHSASCRFLQTGLCQRSLGLGPRNKNRLVTAENFLFALN